MVPTTKELAIAGTTVAPGEYKETTLKVSEFYTATAVQVPVFLKRGPTDGPILFVTAAVHGDEINGVQIVRDLVLDLKDAELVGTLVGVPVVNRFGFINHDRYLPDRRDLNRSFPGDPEGSAAQRYAHRIFSEILARCTHGVDLHTAGYSRTNLPHVRADTEDPASKAMAKAFGTSLILQHRGPRSTLRRTCTAAGIPTVIYEAGETFRFQRDVVAAGRRGILNVMQHLGMLDGEPAKPEYQVVVKSTTWVRASRGGILDVYVRPGDLVYEGDEVAVTTSPFGREVATTKSPVTGLVLGTTTLPLVNPGNPVCHVAKLEKTLKVVERFLERRTGPDRVPTHQEPRPD